MLSSNVDVACVLSGCEHLGTVSLVHTSMALI